MDVPSTSAIEYQNGKTDYVIIVGNTNINKQVKTKVNIMVLMPKCEKCFSEIANAGGCKGCGKWFCKAHIYRHNDCQEGR